MKRTSKKLLSFILAVVMVVTSCSVGFTAFAADGSSQSTGYWNNTTDAQDAYQSIQSLIDQLIPTILGIEVEMKARKKLSANFSVCPRTMSKTPTSRQ